MLDMEKISAFKDNFQKIVKQNLDKFPDYGKNANSDIVLYFTPSEFKMIINHFIVHNPYTIKSAKIRNDFYEFDQMVSDYGKWVLAIFTSEYDKAVLEGTIAPFKAVEQMVELFTRDIKIPFGMKLTDAIGLRNSLNTVVKMEEEVYSDQTVAQFKERLAMAQVIKLTLDVKIGQLLNAEGDRDSVNNLDYRFRRDGLSFSWSVK